MYFLIEYDRETKELVQCKDYKSREKAWEDRFDLEIKLQQEGKIWTEAVVFEAKNRKELEHNHSRYFKNFKGVLSKIKPIERELKKLLKNSN